MLYLFFFAKRRKITWRCLFQSSLFTGLPQQVPLSSKFGFNDFFFVYGILNVFAVVYYVKREKGFQYHIRKLLQLWKNYQLFNSGLKPIKFKYFKLFFNLTNVSYFIQSVQVKLPLNYTNNTKNNKIKNNLLLFCVVFKYEKLNK